MVLGKTVSELQSTMPVGEVILWRSYRKKYGALDPHRKYDLAQAINASTIVRVNGGKAKPSDFMPYLQAEEKIVTGEQFVEMLAGHKGVRVGR
jgi:hypothetical protein